MVFQTKTYVSLVSSLPKSISDKRAAKKRKSLTKIRLDWTYLDLKRNIESQLPREDIMFEYLKVTYFWFLLLDKISN